MSKFILTTKQPPTEQPKSGHVVNKTPCSQPSALDSQVDGDHYKGLPIQHAVFCQKNELTWCEAAATKYVCRHKKKEGIKDLRKAIHYIQICAELEYPNEKL